MNQQNNFNKIIWYWEQNFCWRYIDQKILLNQQNFCSFNKIFFSVCKNPYQVESTRSRALLKMGSQFREQCSHFWERHRFIIAPNTFFSNLRTCVSRIWEHACSRFWEFMYSFLRMNVLILENSCSHFWESMFSFLRKYVFILETPRSHYWESMFSILRMYGFIFGNIRLWKFAFSYKVFLFLFYSFLRILFWAVSCVTYNLYTSFKSVLLKRLSLVTSTGWRRYQILATCTVCDLKTCSD